MGRNRKEIYDQMVACPAQLNRDILSEDFSNNFMDFVNKLLDQNPNSRLGCFGMPEVKAHPFFKGFDWLKVTFKSIKPPFTPYVGSHNVD